MKRMPDRGDFMTRARTAKTSPKNVEATAAKWGLFPKGTETKNDQLARTKPSRRWTTRIRPAFVSAKIRNFHVRATTIQAGK